MNIDESLLTRYMEGFIGFGDLEAKYWFIGIEQGGGKDCAELAKRLKTWNDLGRGEAVDLKAYCSGLYGNENRFHCSNPEIQCTWKAMIQVVLGTRRPAVPRHEIEKYQKESLGRAGGEILLADFFPLPCSTMKAWIYANCSSLDYLLTKRAYRKKMRPGRRTLLHERIGFHKPRAVVFLGKSYESEWLRIVDTPLSRRNTPTPGYLSGRFGDTVCFVTYHPAARGVPYDYFVKIGEELSRCLRESRPS
jgi:hypothetical protein